MRKASFRFAVVAAVLLVASLASGASLSFLSLAVPTSVAAGTPTAVGALERKTVSIESMGSATCTIQISLDTSATPASTSWLNEATITTGTSATFEITKPCAWIRVNCSAYTNGTPTGRIAGILRQ